MQNHSWTIAIAAALVMLLIAAPATALRLGSSDASNDPVHFTTYKAYKLLAEGFGKGFNGPLLVVAQVPKPNASRQPQQGALLHRAELERGKAAVEKLRAAIAGDAGVASVAPAEVQSRAGTWPRSRSIRPPRRRSTRRPSSYRICAARSSRPSRRQHRHARLRRRRHGRSGRLRQRARRRSCRCSSAWSCCSRRCCLMVVFRSLVIPLQAAFMNLLSIGASLGVIVVVFQWGWFDGLMGVNGGPIESFIPVMLFAIVFGLSMDYEVFLVSRIHEQWTRNGDSRRAVSEGLALTGRVVTAAAAIMICVFLSFMLGESRVIKEFGLSLASAVFLDAVIVRCLLLPAVLNILGDATWTIPAWLDRILPRLNIEGGATRLSPADEAELAALRRRGDSPCQPARRGGDRGLSRARGGLLAALLCLVPHRLSPLPLCGVTARRDSGSSAPRSVTAIRALGAGRLPRSRPLADGRLRRRRDRARARLDTGALDRHPERHAGHLQDRPAAARHHPGSTRLLLRLQPRLPVLRCSTRSGIGTAQVQPATPSATRAERRPARSDPNC